MYIRKYSKFKEFEQVGEHQIVLPDPPNLWEIQSHKLSPKNQKFYHTQIPHDREIMSWSMAQQRKFVEEEFTKRKNGVWIYINETPTFIPPLHYYFLNYWRTQNEKLPDYKEANRLVMLFIDFVLRDKASSGGFAVKPRGIGWTDMIDCVLLERATRIKAARNIMFSVDKDRNLGSMRRIKLSLRRMPFYFRPNQGKNKEDYIGFEQETEINSAKKNKKIYSLVEEKTEELDYMNSFIQAVANVKGKADSDRFKTMSVDEYGKDTAKNTVRIDLERQHDINKYCLFLENGRQQVGKIFYGSTIEDDTDEGLMVEQVKAMWDKSNHNERLPNGRTVSDLLRVLFPAYYGAATDEFGMYKKEEFLKEYNGTVQHLLSIGGIKDLISYRRKQCLTIEDALSFPSKTPLFDQERLEKQLWDVQNYTDDFGNVTIHKGVRGRLFWKDGIRLGGVEWEADENGEWEMFRNEPNNNAFIIQGGVKIPANRHSYGMGIDPYETKKDKVHSGLSKGTCVVFRKFDATIDEDDAPKRQWKTYQIAATYSFRHKDPMRFCEDMLMTAIYFGTDALIEKGRGNLLTKYFTDNQCGAYLQFAHRQFGSKTDVREAGVTPNENTIGDYVMMMMDYVYHYSEIIYSESLLKQLLNFENERKSRTKSDLAVAFGWALLAMHKNYSIPVAQISNDDWITTYRI